uniref:Uncharacterized protein n=1 Tax=Pseudo-nitzschia australis TaxID=44445 RepID=A0A7S4EHE0_9STRA
MKKNQKSTRRHAAKIPQNASTKLYPREKTGRFFGDVAISDIYGTTAGKELKPSNQVINHIGEKKRYSLNPERLLCGLKKRGERENDDHLFQKNTLDVKAANSDEDGTFHDLKSKCPQSSRKQESSPFNESTTTVTHRFVFSNDRHDANVSFEESPSWKKKNELNTSMETATTAGTEDEVSLCRIEVKDTSTMPGLPSSAVLPQAKSPPQTKRRERSKANMQIRTEEEEKDNDCAYILHDIAAAVSNTVTSTSTDEKSNDDEANDYIYMLQDIVTAVSNAVTSPCMNEKPKSIEGLLRRVSMFVEEVAEKDNYSLIGIGNDIRKERDENKNLSEQRKHSKKKNLRTEANCVGVMLDAIYIPTSSMKKLECSNNDKEDFFPFLGNSISWDLDASLLSWDLESVLGSDRSQSIRSDRSEPLQEKQQSRSINGDNDGGVAFLPIVGDPAVSAPNPQNPDLPQFHSGDCKKSLKGDNAREFDPRSSLFGHLPYRAAKTTVSKQVAEDCAVPDLALHELKAEKENSSLRSEENVAVVNDDNDNVDDDINDDVDDGIHPITRLSFRAIVPSNPKRPMEDEGHSPKILVEPERANIEIHSSSPSRRNFLSDNNSNDNDDDDDEDEECEIQKSRFVFVESKLPPKQPERTRRKTSFVSNQERIKLLLKAQQVRQSQAQTTTKTSVQTASTSSTVAREKTKAKAANGQSILDHKNSRNSSKHGSNNNYVVDENGFLVDTASVLEDFEKCFEKNSQQGKRKQGSLPLVSAPTSPHSSGENNSSKTLKNALKKKPTGESKIGIVAVGISTNVATLQRRK